jgi:hypothetical protein
MQNKPNFPDTQMNASLVKTKSYEQKTMNCEPAKQSQNKPNQTQFMASLSNQQSQSKDGKCQGELSAFKGGRKQFENVFCKCKLCRLC